MKNQDLALTITLKGQERVINDLNTLKRVIRDAQTEVAILKERGDTTFLAYEEEIEKVIDRYEQLKRSIGGTKFDQQIAEFTRFANVVTQSFVLATNALSLFGQDSEDAARQAASAQQTLAIAYTVSQLAKEKDTFETIKNTTAKVANTFATQGLVAATRLLFTTLLANPLVAVTILVGGLALAYNELTKSEREAAKAQAEFNKQINQEAGKSISQLRIIKQTLEDTTTSLNERKKAVQDLNKLFPGYLSDLEQEKLLTGDLVLNYEALEKALIKQITARALESKASELISKQREEEQKLNILYQERKDRLDAAKISLDDLLAVLIGGGIGSALKVPTDLLKISNSIDDSKENIKSYREEIDLLIKDIVKLNNETAPFFPGEGEGADGENEALQRLKEQIQLREELNRKLLQNLLNTGKISEVEFSESIREQNNELKQLTGSLDAYNRVLDDYAELSRGKEFIFSNYTLEQAERLLEALEQFPEDLKNVDLPQAQRLAAKIEFIKNTLQGLGTTITDIDFTKIIMDVENIDEDMTLTLEDIISRREAAYNLENQFIKDYVDTRIAGSKNVGEALEFERQEYTKTAQVVFDALKSNVVSVNQFTTALKTAVSEQQKLIKENMNLANSAEALTGFLQKNRENITAQFQFKIGDLQSNREDLLTLEDEINTKRFDQARKFQTDIEFLEYQLLQQGIDIRGAAYQEKLILLQMFLQKEVDAEEDAEKKKRDARQKTLNDIKTGIQEIQGVLNSYAQLTQSYYQNQLNALEAQNARVQEKIVGTTEEANQKRLDAERIYQEKRKEIEKRAAKTALQISLAQAVANAAASIVKITEQTGVLAPIAATIVAGINVAQIAQIRSQISAIDSYQKGGFIKMADGGVVVGPPHEYGGVKYAQGGVELEGGEAVINRVSSIRYAPLLSEINQAGGGKPLVVNNFDDSRIVEAIAKNRTEPLRAYVLEQDITEKQQVQARLEQLSQI